MTRLARLRDGVKSIGPGLHVTWASSEHVWDRYSCAHTPLLVQVGHNNLNCPSESGHAAQWRLEFLLGLGVASVGACSSSVGQQWPQYPMEASVVAPVDPVRGRELDLFDTSPRCRRTTGESKRRTACPNAFSQQCILGQDAANPWSTAVFQGACRWCL